MKQHNGFCMKHLIWDKMVKTTGWQFFCLLSVVGSWKHHFFKQKRISFYFPISGFTLKFWTCPLFFLPRFRGQINNFSTKLYQLNYNQIWGQWIYQPVSWQYHIKMKLFLVEFDLTKNQTLVVMKQMKPRKQKQSVL